MGHMIDRIILTQPVIIWSYVMGAGISLLSLLLGYVIGRYNRRQKIDEIARLYAGEELDRLRALCAAQEAELRPYRAMVKVLGVTVDEIVSARIRSS